MVGSFSVSGHAGRASDRNRPRIVPGTDECFQPCATLRKEVSSDVCMTVA